MSNNIKNFDLDETERGNIWLAGEESHNIWIKLGEQKWLQIAIRPENYPGLTVNTITSTDEALAKHINKECVDMFVRKLNLSGVKVKDNYVVGDE